MHHLAAAVLRHVVRCLLSIVLPQLDPAAAAAAVVPLPAKVGCSTLVAGLRWLPLVCPECLPVHGSQLCSGCVGLQLRMPVMLLCSCSSQSQASVNLCHCLLLQLFRAPSHCWVTMRRKVTT
jgi:hypothetical protein